MVKGWYKAIFPFERVLRTEFTMYDRNPNCSVKMRTIIDDSLYLMKLRTMPLVDEIIL